MLSLILMLISAYVLGSIPSSVWIGKWFRGIDLREYGSGNAGTTNAFRVLGKGPGTLVLVLDMLKGYAAVHLSALQTLVNPGTEGWVILQIVLGMIAVAGHVFPVFAGFRGGKGVATIAGIGLALHLPSALAALGVYVLVVVIGRISSLGSLAAVVCYPFWMILIFGTEYTSLKFFSLMVPIMVLITHRKNLVRLIKGLEH